MLPDMSDKVSFLPPTLAPEEMKPGLVAGRPALITKGAVIIAYLFSENRVKETPVRTST